MAVSVKEVSSRSDLKQFIHLPSKIYRKNPKWLPPVYIDEWNYFNPAKNKAHEYSDTILFLACKEGKPMGRIMGIINRKYNEIKNEKKARFEFLSCFNDFEVFQALVLKIEEWAVAKGMESIIGPFGFSDKNPQGFLIEGFEHHAIVIANYNQPYMNEFAERCGYKKMVDLLSYLIKVPGKLPEFYERINQRVLRNNDLELVEFKYRKEILPYVQPVFEVVNETFTQIYGFNPVTQKEAGDFAKQYLPVLHPEFIKLVKVKGEVIAFILGIPDFSSGIKKAKGYLYPLGVFHILKSAKKSRRLVLLLGGIKPKYRGIGIDVLMGYNILKSAAKLGYTEIDTHLVLETNIKYRAEVEKMNGRIYKRFRIYEKALTLNR